MTTNKKLGKGLSSLLGNKEYILREDSEKKNDKGLFFFISNSSNFFFLLI